MAFKIQLNEDIDQAIKRIMIELLNDSIKNLNKVGLRFDESIHEARKNFKKLRAVIRLVRFELGYDLYKKENILYRDTSRLLSGIRDAAVMVESVDYLKKQYPNEIDKSYSKELRRKLSLHARRVRAQFKKNNDLISAIKNILEVHIQEVRDFPLNKRNFRLVAPGMKLVFERGLNGLAEAKVNPSAENFHEWRKRAKYLWYHTRIFENAWPEYMNPLADKLSSLSDILGREHDLAELRDLINLDADLQIDESNCSKFLNYLGQARLILQAQAMTIAPYIYSETSEQFVYRIESYWNQSVNIL